MKKVVFILIALISIGTFIFTGCKKKSGLPTEVKKEKPLQISVHEFANIAVNKAVARSLSSGSLDIFAEDYNYEIVNSSEQVASVSMLKDTLTYSLVYKYAKKYKLPSIVILCKVDSEWGKLYGLGANYRPHMGVDNLNQILNNRGETFVIETKPYFSHIPTYLVNIGEYWAVYDSNGAEMPKW